MRLDCHVAASRAASVGQAAAAVRVRSSSSSIAEQQQQQQADCTSGAASKIASPNHNSTAESCAITAPPKKLEFTTKSPHAILSAAANGKIGSKLGQNQLKFDSKKAWHLKRVKPAEGDEVCS